MISASQGLITIRLTRQQVEPGLHMSPLARPCLPVDRLRFSVKLKKALPDNMLLFHIHMLST